jgi:hypothetical protein
MSAKRQNSRRQATVISRSGQKRRCWLVWSTAALRRVHMYSHPRQDYRNRDRWKKTHDRAPHKQIDNAKSSECVPADGSSRSWLPVKGQHRFRQMLSAKQFTRATLGCRAEYRRDHHRHKRYGRSCHSVGRVYLGRSLTLIRPASGRPETHLELSPPAASW